MESTMHGDHDSETLVKKAELAVYQVRPRPAPSARQPRDLDAQAGGVQPPRNARRRSSHPTRRPGGRFRVRDALRGRPTSEQSTSAT